MYSINLLPLQYQKNEKNQSLKNRLIYITAILLLVLFAVYRLLISLGNQYYDQYTLLAADNVKLSQLIESLQSSDPSLKDKGEIDTLIAQITEGGRDFRKTLIMISNSAPEDVEITSYDMRSGDTGYACIVAANAASYQSVSDWIQSLSSLEGIGEITSSYITTGENKTADTTQNTTQSTMQNPSGSGTDNASDSGSSGVQFELRIPIV